MPEEYKIDYTGIQIPDIEAIKRTSQQFTNWRRSMGFQTEEEKNAALTAEMQAAQQRFNDQDLWNSEDPYEVYNVYETDPVKQAEFRRNGQMVAGVGSTLATLPFTAGIMGGWTPAIVSTATGAAGGHAGAYGGQKLGQYIDDKYGTNLTPGLTFAGGLIGGTIGGGLGYKGWEGATNQYLINKAFKSGQLKWGQPTSYTAYHQSATPITKFKFPFKRWDVAKHGADPNGAFFTVGKPAGSGFLAERPYTGQFQVKVQKPLIQTGELTGPTKNGLRNAIVRRARKNGADAVFFDGIADNQLQNQQILFAMDNADIGYRGMVGTPFKQGNWQSPRGVRNQVLNGHLKGDDAVQMFKDYGVVPIPANSKIYSDIQKLVPEARERYGLVGHTGIADDEIAGSLYKRAIELNGEGNAAVWTETGEPRLLFRGDTRRYKRLMDRMSPEKLATKKGTMDNSLGNLFLSYPDHYQGADRYLGTARLFDHQWSMNGSGTGSQPVSIIRNMTFDDTFRLPEGTRVLYEGTQGIYPIKVYKLPAHSMESGVNDLNTFVVRTKGLRDASDEISVLNDDWLVMRPNFKGKTKLIEDENGFPMYLNEDGTTSPALAGYDARKGMSEHYRWLLDDAQQRGQGLLWSKPGSALRDEHSSFDYYALPNFNRQNAKHLFGWDLRRPVQWNVDNIYLEKGGKIENPDH